ncbi:FprA family A-type flavoprotein [Geosporobacter ferrireducens]|uniref:Flavodoxin n=1 Tax=Geosporobacter ferrireducens TaxID=1424294 RepID=A0A1D8GCQ8_9FIRM|nr:FprA family A-type flavoprotein [Geosporobacter ferrireducens]AOT68693.1 flavodoxin [Geosporobacter ferrireducens]MTI57579.1 FprA family A-type flavoprotein [Geosporobacter ferrireducens]
MFNSVKVTEDIYWVGVNDRRTALFENLWPLEHGVAYNSYLLVDEKIALIDTVEGGQVGEYVRKIQSIIGTHKKIDYLIINHMEPDHSGLIQSVVELYPDIKIVGNEKTFGMIADFYGITNNTHLVKDGDEINLGKHQLKFYMTPMVHWPETMMTYDQSSQILFSGDAFGSFGALDGGIFDDEVDLVFFEEEMRRYYANIVGKYGAPVQAALKKLHGLEISTICATHGPIWRSDIQKVVSLYDQWSKCEAEEGVVIVYGTMYGNTGKMAETIARTLSEEGIKNIKIYDGSKTHMSYILRDIWKYKGLIIGSCAYNNNLFPPIESLTSKLVHMGVKNRILGIFGTYSWSGGGVINLKKFAEQIKWPLIAEPVEAKCAACGNDIDGCVMIGKQMAKALKEA